MANQAPSFAALADPTRLAVFERLAQGPAAVHEIAAGFPVSRPAVSQHLRVLKEAGLVFDRQLGNRRLYQLNPAGIQSMRGYFDRFWSEALSSFKSFVEDTEPKKPSPKNGTNHPKFSRPKSHRRKR